MKTMTLPKEYKPTSKRIQKALDDQRKTLRLEYEKKIKEVRAEIFRISNQNTAVSNRFHSDAMQKAELKHFNEKLDLQKQIRIFKIASIVLAGVAMVETIFLLL